MNYSIDVPVTDEEFAVAQRFGPIFGYLALNIAVILAPLDTGNLRRSIGITSNTRLRKTIRYNTMNANYTKFLELGLGPVKKHKGFISEDTTLAITEGVINLIKTGEYPFLSFTPQIQLKDTSRLFSREKQILKAHDIKSNAISAEIRRKISRIQEANYRKSVGIMDFSVKGKTGLTSKDYAYGTNRGGSALTQSYKKIIK